MRLCAAALACVLSVVIAACGDHGNAGRASPPTSSAAHTSTVDVEEARLRPSPYDPPAGGPISGRKVLDASGCLACHQLGSAGSSGPGSNLGGIGGRMSVAEIRRALIETAAPMPSYRAMPREQLDALVVYLSALPGDCPEGADCG